MPKKTKATKKTKKTKATKKTPKASPSTKASPTKPEPSASEQSEAAATVVRAWLADAYFREDPHLKDPERVEILGPCWDGVQRQHYVDVRIYVPQVDVDAQVAGAHEEITT